MTREKLDRDPVDIRESFDAVGHDRLDVGFARLQVSTRPLDDHYRCRGGRWLILQDVVLRHGYVHTRSDDSVEL